MKINFNIAALNLHNVKHSDAQNLVENYVLCNQNNLPLKIITGDSDKMKSIVIQCLKTHRFKYQIGDYYNRGYIVILK